MGNRRGSVLVRARITDGMAPGTLIVEGIWPSQDFVGGQGINTLVSDAPVPPNGGVGFHDVAVWIKPALVGG
jgi:anaerobic selenocysteine-containing dehydrogenase